MIEAAVVEIGEAKLFQDQGQFDYPGSILGRGS
jgi:hypothetical protein